jgi:formamidopyrimidine-DNA glycosylase
MSIRYGARGTVEQPVTREMPELPEVETVRRGLLPSLEGRRIARVVTRRPDLRVAFPPRFAERLTGQRVVSLSRRAKYILAELESGDILLLHLGMSGRVSVSANGSGEGKHDHVIIETEDGARIVYTDHRRFGLMTLISPDERDTHKLLIGLGPEPLSPAFNARYLAKALKGKKTPIKAALLDQRIVAGLGNIYVCEALFRAGISPKRLAGSVTAARIGPLVKEIQQVLKDAIAAGGSTLRDYQHTDGELGYFQHAFQVYDRKGERCANRDCGGTIKRLVQSGRSTFFCPRCQR